MDHMCKIIFPLWHPSPVTNHYVFMHTHAIYTCVYVYMYVSQHLCNGASMDTTMCANHTRCYPHSLFFFVPAMLLQSGLHVNREATYNHCSCQHFTTLVQNTQDKNTELCILCSIKFSVGLEFWMVLFVFGCINSSQIEKKQKQKQNFNLSRIWKG